MTDVANGRMLATDNDICACVALCAAAQTLQVPIKYGVAILGETRKKRELTCAASQGRGASLPAADRVTDSSLFEIFTRSLTADIESEREVNGRIGGCRRQSRIPEPLDALGATAYTGVPEAKGGPRGVGLGCCSPQS